LRWLKRREFVSSYFTKSGEQPIKSNKGKVKLEYQQENKKKTEENWMEWTDWMEWKDWMGTERTEGTESAFYRLQ
jgi:hypothetical protein